MACPADTIELASSTESINPIKIDERLSSALIVILLRFNSRFSMGTSERRPPITGIAYSLSFSVSLLTGWRGRAASSLACSTFRLTSLPCALFRLGIGALEEEDAASVLSVVIPVRVPLVVTLYGASGQWLKSSSRHVNS